MASQQIPSKFVTFVLPGGWLPPNPKLIRKYIENLKKYVKENPTPLVTPIEELKVMVEANPLMLAQWELMFKNQKPADGEPPQVENFGEFLTLLNAIMTQAPEYTATPSESGPQPTGLIGFPINALLNWPMATASGYQVFSDQIINQQFKRILDYWCNFLSGEDSRYVLDTPKKAPKAKKSQSLGDVEIYAWLSDVAKQEMVNVATVADSSAKDQPFHYFYKCDPNQDYYGFNSWDDFFTRQFNDGIRPVATGSSDIANACESAPLQHIADVKLTDQFWIKSQPYSLANMMDFDPLSQQFDGATVYQAFLSALSYHRWHSPITGTVVKAYLVSGTYYLPNRHQHDDTSAPNDSQSFLTSVAARAVIFLRSDNPDIDLMCFVAVGMAEVSSCEISVQDGQRINKGDELGMFHFGGSTHCLVFRKGLKVDFHFDRYNTTPGLHATNIPLKACLCTVTK